MAMACKHKWEPFTKWKARCSRCDHREPWLDIVSGLANAPSPDARRADEVGEGVAQLVRDWRRFGQDSDEVGAAFEDLRRTWARHEELKAETSDRGAATKARSK